jgi:hypothetical protein
MKNKGIPVTDRGSQQDYEMLRILHYLNNQLTYSGEVVGLAVRLSVLRRPRSAPRNISFLDLRFIYVRA